MAAPTLLDYATSTWTDSSATTETTDDLDWNASGDVIVVLGATEDNGLAMATPTGTGITLAALSGLPTNTANSAKVYGWNATASGNGNTVLTSTNGASGARGIAAWAFSGSAGLGTPVVNVGTSIVVSVTVAQDSSVCMILADWNATADVTVTTDPVGGTIRQATQVSGLATFLVVEWSSQSAGTRNYGVSAWTGTGTVSKAAVEVQGTAGGTAFTRTVDDSAGLTDSASAASAFARTATDVTGLVDTALAALTNTRTQTDSAGLTDSVTPVLFTLHTRTVTDSLGLTDTGDPLTLDVAETVTDSAGLTDAVSVATAFVRVVTDAAGLTDAATPVLNGGGTAFTRTVDDSAGLVDSTAAAAAFARTQTDTAGLADTIAPVSSFARTVTDTTGLTDAASTQLAGAGTRTIDDTVGLTDTVTYSSTQTLTDSAGLTDSVLLVAAWARTAADAAGLTDLVSVAMTRAVAVADSAGVTDSVVVQLSTGTAHTRTVTDSMGLTSAHRCVQTTRRPYAGTTVRPFTGTTSRHPLIPD